MQIRDDGANETALRRAYLVALVVPLLLVAGLWAAQGIDGRFRAVAFATVVAINGPLMVGVATRRLSLRAAGPWVIASPTVVIAARLVLWQAWPQTRPEDVGLVIAALAWLGTLAALAFLVFGTRRGVLISMCGYLVMGLGAGWSAGRGMVAESGSLGAVVFLAGGQAALIGVVWVLARHVEQLAAARAREDLLEAQATTDALTGIANRRRLDDELQRLVARSRRSGAPLSVISVDLDHFKAVNDTFGHDVGDLVLVAAVERFRREVRHGDLLGRWGGEEFLLLAPDTDHDEACILAERFRLRLVEAPVQRGAGDPIEVTASFGVATLDGDDDLRAMMRRADLALYAAKHEGRDRVVGAEQLTSHRGASRRAGPDPQDREGPRP